MPRRARQQRPRAYEPLPTPWRFQDLPLEHQARRTALFVVHGIGTQAYYDTAIALRSGFEDAIYEICGKSRVPADKGKGSGPTGETRAEGQPPLPPPFIFEGYWANYSSMADTFPEEWASFTERERVFFSKLWERRSVGAFRTGWWFIQTNLRLYSAKTIRDFGLGTGLMVMGMTPLTFLTAMGMSVASPKVLAEVLGDVRIYCDPQGSTEDAIVQRIDRRVGEQFLRMLGLDWDFNNLPPDRMLNVSGKPQVFDYVTWISHSLGTIISYNVASDILHRVQERSQALEARLSSGKGTEEDYRLRRNIERVRTGLHRFYTLGSPLHNINLLFPTVVRPWPANAGQVMGAGQTRSWWVNFYHAWDPVSERLGRKFPLAVNRHSPKLWQVPGKVHTDYFSDRHILQHIISRAYGPGLCKWEDPRFLGDTAYLWARRALLVLLSVMAAAVLVLAVWWVVFGGGTVWLLKRVGSWFKRLVE